MTYSEFLVVLEHAADSVGMTTEKALDYIFTIRAEGLPVIPAWWFIRNKKISFVNSSFVGFVINDTSSTEHNTFSTVISQFIPIESVISVSFNFTQYIPESIHLGEIIIYPDTRDNLQRITVKTAQGTNVEALFTVDGDLAVLLDKNKMLRVKAELGADQESILTYYRNDAGEWVEFPNIDTRYIDVVNTDLIIDAADFTVVVNEDGTSDLVMS